jgi:hypothetical protein
MSASSPSRHRGHAARQAVGRAARSRPRRGTARRHGRSRRWWIGSPRCGNGRAWPSFVGSTTRRAWRGRCVSRALVGPGFVPASPTTTTRPHMSAVPWMASEATTSSPEVCHCLWASSSSRLGCTSTGTGHAPSSGTSTRPLRAPRPPAGSSHAASRTLIRRCSSQPSRPSPVLDQAMPPPIRRSLTGAVGGATINSR